MANFNQRSITDFRSRMTGGGARSNLFEVEITFPDELTIVGLSIIVGTFVFDSILKDF